MKKQADGKANIDIAKECNTD